SLFSLTTRALNSLITASSARLPETLLVEATQPGQHEAIQRHAGGEADTLLQALFLREMQMEQLGLGRALGQVLVAGFQLVHQQALLRGHSQPDLARRDGVDVQLRAIARHEALEQ